jgi:hypothetical protein
MAEENKAAQAPAGDAGGEKTDSKHPKVTQMNLAQIDAAIEKTKKSMGGLTSRYGRSLTARRDALKNMGPK